MIAVGEPLRGALANVIRARSPRMAPEDEGPLRTRAILSTAIRLGTEDMPAKGISGHTGAKIKYEGRPCTYVKPSLPPPHGRRRCDCP